MEAPYILISTISPENGKKIDSFDKHSKYIVKVLAPTDFSETLFEYAEYFSDLSQRDRESDSFRYPFHIVWEPGDWKWYKKEAESAVEWKAVNPVFIETGGYYYAQLVVGYKYNRADFYPYTKAYLETANYLKWYMKNETDSGNSDYNERLFLPMCYLYRNCVELSLKTIWFEEIGEDMNMKKVLLLGATGATGKYIMAEFQKRSGAVLTAYVRNPAKMAELDSTGVNVVYGDVTDTEKLKGVMQEQDVVLASLEGDTLSMAKSIIDAMKGSPVSRIIWMTGMGIHHEIKGIHGKVHGRYGVQRNEAGRKPEPWHHELRRETLWNKIRHWIGKSPLG